MSKEKSTEIRLWSAAIRALAVICIGLLLITVSCSDDDDPVSSAADEPEFPFNQTLLPMARTDWHPASEPVQISNGNFERCRLLWHTPRELVPLEYVFDREAQPGESALRTFRLIIRPARENVAEWAGITASFPVSIADSTEYFEVRLLRYDDIEATLHFDFGKISEDINDDGLAFSEDVDLNGAVAEDEDIGLDGIADGQGETPVPWGTSSDPAGDNWYFQGEGKCPLGNCDTVDWDSDRWYYEFLNGTEGNRMDPARAGLPDEEILDGSSGLRITNTYFTFGINLDSDSLLVPNSERNGWVTYRIPIRDTSVVQSVTSGAQPSWNEITHARVWMEAAAGQTQPDTVEIVAAYFVQDASQ